MSGSFVFAMLQDSRGYLWIGTEGGLSRYDGKKFINYGLESGLPSPKVTHIIEDHTGMLWLGTRKGLVSFDGKKFRSYGQLTDDVITYFFMLQETADHRISFNINTTQYICSNDSITKPATIAGIPNDKIVFAWERNNGDLVLQRQIGDRRFTYITTSSGKLVDSLPELDNQYCIYYETPGQSSRLFFASKNAMYEYVDHRLKTLCPLDIAGGSLICQFLDKQNRLWVNTVYHGSYIFNLNTGKLDRVTNQNGLADNFTTYITQDKQQTVWLGHARGLLQLKPQLVNAYHVGLSEPNIGPVVKYKGQYLHLNGNLFYLDRSDGSIKQHPANASLQKIKKQTLCGISIDSKGRLCAIDIYGNLYFYENSRWSVQTDPDNRTTYWNEEVFVNPVTSDLLVPKLDQLFVYKKDNTLQRWDDFGEGRKPKDIEHISFDRKGNAWIVMDSRLYVFNGQRIRPVDVKPTIGSKEIHQTYISGDTLFILTISQGLLVYQLNGEELKFVEKFTVDNGLISNAINSVITDTHGRTWVSTFKGIDLLEKKQDDTTLVKHLGQKDGLSVFTWERSALSKDDEGFIWCKTMRSFFRINPSALSENTTPPDLQLESIEIINKEKEWEKYTDTAAGFFSVPEGIQLPYTFDNITFHFNAINLLNGEAKYSYKLDGVNDEWISTGSKDEVSYYNLESGDYTFRVKAVNENGISSRELTYSFTIRPPFWKTWWFRSLLGLVVVALIFWLIKRRERSIHEQNRMELQLSELRLQALQSQMNPHFIFNSLNSIQSFIVKNNPIEAARYLAKFSALMRRILDNSHHQFQPLDTIIETLQLYVELESFRFSKGFSYKFDITDDPAREEVMLPPMLLQPFVENAILHGLMPKEGEKNLLIRVSVENGDVLCTIEDNGMGRQNAGAKKPGHISRGQQLTAGMVESLKTLRQIHASIEYVDLTNGAGQPAGTRVLIRIPTRNQK
jgi:ligand-binding sensor domain-containing protein